MVQVPVTMDRRQHVSYAASSYTTAYSVLASLCKAAFVANVDTCICIELDMLETGCCKFDMSPLQVCCIHWHRQMRMLDTLCALQIVCCY